VRRLLSNPRISYPCKSVRSASSVFPVAVNLRSHGFICGLYFSKGRAFIHFLNHAHPMVSIILPWIIYPEKIKKPLTSLYNFPEKGLSMIVHIHSPSRLNSVARVRGCSMDHVRYAHINAQAPRSPRFESGRWDFFIFLHRDTSYITMKKKR